MAWASGILLNCAAGLGDADALAALSALLPCLNPTGDAQQNGNAAGAIMNITGRSPEAAAALIAGDGLHPLLELLPVLRDEPGAACFVAGAVANALMSVEGREALLAVSGVPTLVEASRLRHVGRFGGGDGCEGAGVWVGVVWWEAGWEEVRGSGEG